MKKMSKFTKKLLLSALALCLAVVTLTTTTYAWYTSSTQAQAGSGKANTSTSTDDSSLMISTDGKSFGTSVNLPSTQINMIPLQWKEGKFVDKDNGEAQTGNFYTFDLYFKTTSDASANVYVKSITLTNEVTSIGSLPQYDNLIYGKSVTGAPTSSKYAVDVVKALDLVIKSGDTTTFDSSAVTKSYKLDQAGIGVDGFGETQNANAYYDAFMGTTTTTEAEAYNTGLQTLSRATAIGAVPTGTEGVLKVTFMIYLNGWDAYCFDACKGQSFTINMVFSTSDAD